MNLNYHWHVLNVITNCYVFFVQYQLQLQYYTCWKALNPSNLVVVCKPLNSQLDFTKESARLFNYDLYLSSTPITPIVVLVLYKTIFFILLHDASHCSMTHHCDISTEHCSMEHLLLLTTSLANGLCKSHVVNSTFYCLSYSSVPLCIWTYFLNEGAGRVFVNRSTLFSSPGMYLIWNKPSFFIENIA